MAKLTPYQVLCNAAQTEQAIERLEAEIRAKTQSVSERVLELAQRYSDLDTFLDECKQAEDRFKDEKGVTQIPSHWSQAKSNVKQAWKAGLEPADYQTESSMRKDLNELRKRKRQTEAHKAEASKRDNPRKAEAEGSKKVYEGEPQPIGYEPSAGPAPATGTKNQKVAKPEQNEADKQMDALLDVLAQVDYKDSEAVDQVADVLAQATEAIQEVLDGQKIAKALEEGTTEQPQQAQAS